MSNAAAPFQNDMLKYSHSVEIVDCDAPVPKKRRKRIRSGSDEDPEWRARATNGCRDLKKSDSRDCTECGEDCKKHKRGRRADDSPSVALPNAYECTLCKDKCVALA